MRREQKKRWRKDELEEEGEKKRSKEEGSERTRNVN